MWGLWNNVRYYFRYYLVRNYFYQRILLYSNGVVNCTDTSEQNFKQKAIWSKPQVCFWQVGTEADHCLRMGFLWRDPSIPKKSGTVTCHWLYYSNGRIRHSCALDPDASRDKTTYIVFKEREEIVDKGIAAAFDRVALNQNQPLTYDIVTEIEAKTKKFMLSVPEFAHHLDPNTFEPRLSEIHRTMVAVGE